LNDFVSKHSIVHQSSCSYTPQQNRAAGNKERYLLGITRTLLFQMNVAECFGIMQFSQHGT